jgi:hypothetical protein
MFISKENIWSLYRNSKTTRVAYLGQDLSIHVNIMQLNLSGGPFPLSDHQPE